jgi:transcriptional regulator with XRE-family HTH domain
MPRKRHVGNVDRAAVYRYIGGNIRRVRQEQRYSQDALGARLNPPVTHAAISSIEAGISAPDVSYLMQIGIALGVTIAEFLGPDLYVVGLREKETSV